jgi:hypothetical protein
MSAFQQNAFQGDGFQEGRTFDLQVVVPTTATLTLTTFAPTVTATQNQLVVPTTKALVITTFAPTVTASDHKVVTPTTATLTLTTFAPVVTATDHQVVTPGVAALVLTTFAPTVTATNNGPPAAVNGTITNMAAERARRAMIERRARAAAYARTRRRMDESLLLAVAGDEVGY